MTTGTSVTVLVDGVEAADGCNSEDYDQPVILDNLSVTWGRSDTMSQPEADTCSFEIMDPTGEGFSGAVRTGSRIDVLARGVVDESASTPTFVNPGFETDTVTWATTGGTAARTTVRSVSAPYSLNVRPSVSSAPVALLLAPAPFVAPGTDPDAWDDIPTVELGETWTLSVALWLPRGATAQIQPMLFTGPYSAAATPTPDAPRIVTGEARWINYTIAYTVAADVTRWLGMQITLSPAGLAWDEMPPTLTWDTVDPTWNWDDLGTMYVDDAQVTSPASPSAATVLVFSGRVTELSASWDDAADAPVVAVTASGFTADLENRRVGDEPWNVESVDARSNRILSLAGLPISIDIDTSIDQTLLSWRDVDTQGALGLLQSIAVSVDAVLWPAVHSAIGAYLRMEDPAMRPSLLKLTEYLGSPPVVERTNTVINPDFETSPTVGWASFFSPTVTRDTTEKHSGAASMKVVKTNATQAQGRIAGSQPVPVPGDTLHAVAWVKGAAGINMRLSFKKDGGSVGSGSFAFTTNGAWQRVETRFTVPDPAAAYYQPMIITAGNSDPVGTTFWVDDVFCEHNTDGDPFTGDTPDTATKNFAWTGTAHETTSTQSTVQTRLIVIVQSDPDEGVNVSACDVLRDPVTWIQSVADIATRAYVSWKQQGVDEEGLPTTTDITEVEIDAPLEQRHGTRTVSISTELQSQADAQDVASRVLARTSSDAWRAGGVTIDDDDLMPGDDTEMLLFLLDGTSRIGSPVVLTDMPEWAPGGTRTGTYLEGGTYSFTGGRWVLQLVVSSAGSGVGQSAQWDELDPSWTWNEWDPSLTWNDLRGVAAP